MKLGTRKSVMARAAAQQAKILIESAHREVAVSVAEFSSEGDLIEGDLRPFGGKGTFIKDLEKRLLSGEIDCAIHALKDIPGDIPMHEDLQICAYIARTDARDAVVLREGVTSANLDMRGTRIGTSAPRRTAVLNRMFPSAQVVPCRGNAIKRLEKLDRGDYDALIMSAVGLEWIGLQQRIHRRFNLEEFIPAVGQGILVLQARKIDRSIKEILAGINSIETENLAMAERQILYRLQGNCHSAIAANCVIEGEQVILRACVFAPSLEADCTVEVNSGRELCDYLSLGNVAADRLISLGCKKFL